jgi:hypothetical protein
MSIKKYSDYIALHEQKTKTIGLRPVEINEAEDRLYGQDYESTRPSKKFNDALDHIEKSKYKVNHDGGGDEDTKDHEKPDVTLHYAYGDDIPHSYTVHHDGAAAKDKVLHIRHLRFKE